jgi:acyl-coenzyme A synthetase/AMP-(fatty) acid ligase
LKQCAIFLSRWSLDTKNRAGPEILLEVADYPRTASGKVQNRLVRHRPGKTLQ